MTCGITRRTRLRCIRRFPSKSKASSGWRDGEEFIFEVEEEAYVTPGLESSALVVRHQGAGYEIFYYDGSLAETITDNCSWDR